VTSVAVVGWPEEMAPWAFFCLHTQKEEIAMRKFWKKQVEDLGGDASVLLKGRTQLAKEMVISLVAAHKEAITLRNAGYVIGRAACVVKKPCAEFWQGVKDGFDN
jgi:hypothetical protein